MATYKLIQDIEAEDKILGPLTLRQFIYALVAVFLLYICFVLVFKLHAAFLLVLFLPPALFCAFFAFPFGRDQPTEVWALAKLRFWLKPRRRVWNQSGVKELVTITVPKKVERVLTKSFSQTEVKSRLRALADTLDTRGWAVKNVTTDTYITPLAATDSDRLIDLSSLPQEVPGDVISAEDILDETNNPVARQVGVMIDESSRSHRQRLMEQLNDIRQAEAAKQTAAGSNWFLGSNPAGGAQAPSDDQADELALSARLADKASSRQVSFGNLRSVRPLSSSVGGAQRVTPDDKAADDQLKAAPVKPDEPMTAPDDPAILSLAKNNDLNVSTLARQARKNKGDEQDGEVVISLH